MTILRTNTIAGIGETFGPLLDGDLEFNSQNYIVLPKGSSNQQGVLRTTEDVIGVGGTYYDNLVLAMPFNEATGLRDVSSRNRNPGAYGNVAISTAQSKYYGSSAYFDGSGNVIDTGDSYDFAFGTGDWTFEYWIYPTTLGTRLIESSTNSDNLDTGPSGAISYWNGSGNVVSANGVLTTNNWFHIALVRYNGTATIYVNGFSVVAQASTPNTTTPRKYWIGGLNETRFQGYMNDLRFYKGLAKYTANFTPPERIAEIGVGFKAGQLRYNTDSNKVELYDGSQWAEVQSSRPDLNGGARGLFGGGYLGFTVSSPYYNVIDYITISSTGNAIDFGDRINDGHGVGSCSSSTRGVFAGGRGSAPVGVNNVIDYITISSTGNAIDFGDLSGVRYRVTGLSNSTRGIFAGGQIDSPATTLYNIIEYITLASIGNVVDFGDLSTVRIGISGCSSPIRGIFAGGATPTISNTIEYITIATTGNAQDFGDLTTASNMGAGCSNPIRGLFCGAATPSLVNTMEFITISTLGNAVKFGELSQARFHIGSCSNSVRGLFAGGGFPTPTPTNSNIIDYVTILTQGNAVDFGDLTVARNSVSACSNAHGGL